jgi:phosphate transport system substrate-binding protein
MGRATARDGCRFFMLAICCLLALSACAPTPVPAPTPQPAELDLAGDPMMYSLAQALLSAYMERFPQVTVRLETGALRDGVKAVQDGHADIGLVARELAADELGSIIATPIGLDGIIVAINARNPVKTLSLEQLRKLYSGEIWDWATLGGRSGDVQVVSREGTADTRRAFEGKVMAGKRVTLQAVVVPSDAAVAEYVVGNELAIGYLAVGALRPGLKGLSIEGVPPDKSHVRQGDYSLTRPLFLTTKAAPEEPVRAFMAFVLSPAGQAIVERYHVRIQ